MDYELATHSEPEPRLDLRERPTRMLHVMLRVFNLQHSLDFYIGALGMQMLRRQDYPSGRFTLVFLGYGSEDSDTVLELTHNWDQQEPYALGSAYGHIALAVSDIYATCGDLAEAGVKITRSPGPMKHSPTLIAFIEDPDGYKIELIGRK
jgi:lactoylglutathione lyase